MANEGRFVLFLPAHQADRALAVLQRFQPSAASIGCVRGEAVLLETSLGLQRRLELGRGESLPRIC
jgi:hydrogenase expression/formation protein HypE